MIRVLYDHQIYTNQSFGGVSRYFTELLLQFNNNRKIDWHLALRFSNNYYLKEVLDIKTKSFFSNLRYKGKWHIQNQLNQHYTITEIRKRQFDIFHPTYYNPYFLKFLHGRPFVLTVHDMTREKLDYTFLKKDKTASHKKILIEKAEKIIAVSQNTKNDIIKLLKVPHDKIVVIYHGVPHLLKKNLIKNARNVKLPNRYILYLGNRYIYKNFVPFLKALAPLLFKNKTLTLLCVGGGEFTQQELDTADRMGIRKQIFQCWLEDIQLPEAFAKAEFFVFPSLYEGFGLPILEAWANSCPIALSNASCFPEIAEDAALYFNPHSIEDMTDALQRLVKDKELRKNLVVRGFKRLCNFTWEKCASQTASLYEKVLGV